MALHRSHQLVRQGFRQGGPTEKAPLNPVNIQSPAAFSTDSARGGPCRQ